MSNRIDQVFKGLLGEYKIQPSAEAWTKVQAGLSKKNKIIFAWRLAAAFLLFGSLLGTWFYVQREPAQLSETIIVPEVNKEIEVAIKPTMEKSLPPQATAKRKSKKEKRVAIVETIPIAKNAFEDNEVEQAKVYNIATIAEPTRMAKSEKPLVIEFTLETISTEPIQEVEAATTEVNSGLKKILDVARDVKNGDTDLGIRDAKNQLFAFDFKKDKLKRN